MLLYSLQWLYWKKKVSKSWHGDGGMGTTVCAGGTVYTAAILKIIWQLLTKWNIHFMSPRNFKHLPKRNKNKKSYTNVYSSFIHNSQNENSKMPTNKSVDGQRVVHAHNEMLLTYAVYPHNEMLVTVKRNILWAGHLSYRKNPATRDQITYDSIERK